MTYNFINPCWGNSAVTDSSNSSMNTKEDKEENKEYKIQNKEVNYICTFYKKSVYVGGYLKNIIANGKKIVHGN